MLTRMGKGMEKDADILKQTADILELHFVPKSRNMDFLVSQVSPVNFRP